MNSTHLEQLATRLLQGQLALPDFLEMAAAPQKAAPKTADLKEAQLDLDRARRCGFPEVVFSQGKTIAALQKIITTLCAEGHDAFCTRMSHEQAAAMLPHFPNAHYHAVAKTFRVPSSKHAYGVRPKPYGRVVVITAGTSDLPIAEEARETLAWMGVHAHLICDVGVAGPHRLRERLEEFVTADAIVVVAGMEGALPSVVGGHVACPVIAVPTSVGYGANFGGLAALLSMLNSCAANVTVVNIDAGFKGGYVAGLIARGKHVAKGSFHDATD
jgi:NCAIR mutase (PurE)-related protein